MNIKLAVTSVALAVFALSQEMETLSSADPAARDPGVRNSPSDATPIAGLGKTEEAFFIAGRDEFIAPEEVTEGLGPTMNLDSCAGCHSQPAVGGSSPTVNPQVGVATKQGATNSSRTGTPFRGLLRGSVCSRGHIYQAMSNG